MCVWACVYLVLFVLNFLCCTHILYIANTLQTVSIVAAFVRAQQHKCNSSSSSINYKNNNYNANHHHMLLLFVLLLLLLLFCLYSCCCLAALAAWVYTHTHGFIEWDSLALLCFAHSLGCFILFSLCLSPLLTHYISLQTHHTVRLSMIYSIVECFHRFMISVTIRLYFGTAAVCYKCVALNIVVFFHYINLFPL